MNSENPPPEVTDEANRLRRSIYTSYIVAAILLVVEVPILYYKADLLTWLSPILVCLYILFWSGRAIKKFTALRKPLPLITWLQNFDAGDTFIEVAFQFPPEFNTKEFQDRIRIAARISLRDFKPDELQQTLKRDLANDVDELRIPVFRIQILAINKKPVPEKVEEKKKDPTIYI